METLFAVLLFVVIAGGLWAWAGFAADEEFERERE